MYFELYNYFHHQRDKNIQHMAQNDTYDKASKFSFVFLPQRVNNLEF